MGTNRIAKYFPTLELTMTNNKFNHVEFEKFDPSITQNIVREFSNDDEIFVLGTLSLTTVICYFSVV